MKRRNRGKLNQDRYVPGRKIRRGLALGMSLFLLSASFTACGKSDIQITESLIDSVDSNLAEDKGITVYHVEGRSVVAAEERFRPKQPDSVASSLEETMAVIPLVEGVRFTGYTMAEENAVTLSLQVEDAVSRETLLLEKAALVNTLEQIRNIGRMTLSVKNTEGETVDEHTYTNGSFYYYDDVIPTGQNNGQICLYLPDPRNGDLTENTLNVTLQLDVSAEEEVVSQLIQRDIFPEGTKLISVSVTQRVAYVDLSTEMLSTEDPKTVYSLVDSVCSLPHISSVQILVDGEKQEAIAGVDTHVPLTFTLVSTYAEP
ncbi:MAG: GerMN domain-containing protein [Eubacterium sp.]|nr:GerMN domain-containing protein [Eubacterium sp.]